MTEREREQDFALLALRESAERDALAERRSDAGAARRPRRPSGDTTRRQNAGDVPRRHAPAERRALRAPRRSAPSRGGACVHASPPKSRARPRGGALLSEQAPHERGLACAVSAEQGVDGAAGGTPRATRRRRRSRRRSGRSGLRRGSGRSRLAPFFQAASSASTAASASRDAERRRQARVSDGGFAQQTRAFAPPHRAAASSAT